jgi:hypothetical protein
MGLREEKSEVRGQIEEVKASAEESATLLLHFDF